MLGIMLGPPRGFGLVGPALRQALPVEVPEAPATGMAVHLALVLLLRYSSEILLGVACVLLSQGFGHERAPAFPTEIVGFEGHGGAFSGGSASLVSSGMEQDVDRGSAL